MGRDRDIASSGTPLRLPSFQMWTEAHLLKDSSGRRQGVLFPVVSQPRDSIWSILLRHGGGSGMEQTGYGDRNEPNQNELTVSLL